MSRHQGGCHCGAVKFEVEGVDLGSAITCNCSICSKRGSILAFVPAAQFHLKKGQDMLTEYLFNKKVIKHLFCKKCGILSFAYGEANGAKMAAINVRCLDDIDVSKLKTTQVNGKDF